MSKNLVRGINMLDAPDDFKLIAQDIRSGELCGYTEEDGYTEVKEIPWGFHQRCLPAEWGDKWMSVKEILAARMSIDGTILALNPVMAAVISTADPLVATPIVDIMSVRSSGDLNFEPFTATVSKHQTLRKGWGYYDSDTGVRGVWVKDTAECGDPAWKPGGAGYANWRIIPQLSDDGIPIWVMGIYAAKGSIWTHDNVVYTSMVNQEPSVWEPGAAPTVWVIKSGKSEN